MDIQSVEMYEISINKEQEWCNRTISELSMPNSIIVFIKREERVILPNGGVRLKENDILVILDNKQRESIAF